MGILGGFLMTVYNKAEGKALTIDAQMVAPINFPFPVKDLNSVKQGSLAIAVPGFLPGLWELHRKYGKLPWRKLVEPTLKMCHEGITITKHLYDSIYMNDRIMSDHYLRELFEDKETHKLKRIGLLK